MKLPQIHLRDFFWLALVVALGLGWWANRRTFLAEQREDMKLVTELSDKIAQQKVDSIRRELELAIEKENVSKP